MSTPLRPRITTAFFTQSVISFAVSLGVTIAGIGYLHESRWIRGFLALGLLYVVTSSFTLAPWPPPSAPAAPAAATPPSPTACTRIPSASPEPAQHRTHLALRHALPPSMPHPRIHPAGHP
jgi:hypothetical protein